MTFTSIGDLAQSFQLRRGNAALKSDFVKLGQELATGRTSDVSKRVAGDFTILSAVESGITRLAAFSRSSGETSFLAESTQAALGRFQQIVQKTAGDILTGSSVGQSTLLRTSVANSEENFSAAVATLNLQVAGKSLFAGVATGGPALAPADEILADIRLAAAGAQNAADVLSALDTWFNAAGGGFETIAYVGSTTSQAAVPVGEGVEVALSNRADDFAIRESLKGLAISVLISDGILSGNPEEEARLGNLAGEKLLDAETRIVDLRAALGATQSLLEQTTAENIAESAALGLARDDLLGTDPYQTVSELEETQNQLETLYALTARLSRLNLLDFLR